MPTGELFTNRPIYTARHHPYDPGIVDDADLPILRDLPGTGRIAWEQVPGSAGRFMGCFDTDPAPTANGGGTWLEFQQGEAALLLVNVYQDDALLTSTQRVNGARRLISQRTAEIEDGVCLLELTIQIQETAGASEEIEVWIDTAETGWDWQPASDDEDYPVGTFRIAGKACGWVWAIASPSPNPIHLRLVDATDGNIGLAVLLEDGDRLMIEGQLLYRAFLSAPE